jgi:hypothetical protein
MDAGAQGIRPPMLKGFFFNTFTHSNRRVYAPGTPNGTICRNCLVPLTFTQSNL